MHCLIKSYFPPILQKLATAISYTHPSGTNVSIKVLVWRGEGGEIFFPLCGLSIENLIKTENGVIKNYRYI